MHMILSLALWSLRNRLACILSFVLSCLSDCICKLERSTRDCVLQPERSSAFEALDKGTAYFTSHASAVNIRISKKKQLANRLYWGNQSRSMHVIRRGQDSNPRVNQCLERCRHLENDKQRTSTYYSALSSIAEQRWESSFGASFDFPTPSLGADRTWEKELTLVMYL